MLPIKNNDFHDGHVLCDLITRFAVLVDMYGRPDLVFCRDRIAADGGWDENQGPFKAAILIELDRQIAERPAKEGGENEVS